MSNNSLSGSPPLIFASARVGSAEGTINIAQNYFDGDNVPRVGPQRTPVCPADVNGTWALTALRRLRGGPWWPRTYPGNASSLASNCFSRLSSQTWARPAAPATLCYLEAQRPSGFCFSFCNASDPRGPCAGLGTCSRDAATGGGICVCRPGAYELATATSRSRTGLLNTCTTDCSLGRLSSSCLLPLPWPSGSILFGCVTVPLVLVLFTILLAEISTGSIHTFQSCYSSKLTTHLLSFLLPCPCALPLQPPSSTVRRVGCVSAPLLYETCICCFRAILNKACSLFMETRSGWDQIRSEQSVFTHCCVPAVPAMTDLASMIPNSATATWLPSVQCGLWAGVGCDCTGNILNM